MNKDYIILNPDYLLRNDTDRIVLYSGKQVQEYSSSEWISYIHPVQAMILSIFSEENILSGKNTFILKKLNLSIDMLERIVRPFVENKTSIYTEFKGHKVLFPKNVLIYASKVTAKSDKLQTCNFMCNTIDLTPDRMHRAPLSLLFMLTNKCATDCKYCYADRHTQYAPLSTNEILKIINEASQLGMTYIDIIGGEVFCRKDWPVIIKRLVDLHLTPNYISTKVPISEHQIKMLSDTGYNNVVQISLDSMCDNTLKSIIGVKKGYINRMVETIKKLNLSGFKIQIDTILTRDSATEANILDLYNFIKTIPNLVYWEIRVPEVSIYSSRHFAKVQATKSQLESIISFIKVKIIPNAVFTIYISDEALCEEYNNAKTDEEYFKGGTCGMLQNRLFILPDGKVSICEQLYWLPQFIIGDLKKNTISEVWTSPKALALFNMKKELFSSESKCYSCKHLELCNSRHRRCFVKVIKAYGKDKWDFPDPRCIYAPKVKSNLIYK